MLLRKQLQSKREAKAFVDLAQLVGDNAQAAGNDGSNITLAGDEPAQNVVADTKLWEEPYTEPSQEPSLYDELIAINSDFTGWLCVPNTLINYPVMATPHDPEFYLHQVFDMTDSHSGTQFLADGCDIDSDCVIIYGHNMNDNSMFGTLDSYRSRDFWEQNPITCFDTRLEHDGNR